MEDIFNVVMKKITVRTKKSSCRENRYVEFRYSEIRL